MLHRHLGLCLVLIFLLQGCAANPNTHRVESMLTQGFVEQNFSTGSFSLFGLLRPGHGDTLHVYIEGDGMAWKSRRYPSSDPTPQDETCLRLAEKDPSLGPVLYLARPCQYTKQGPQCSPKYWTSARLAPEIIDSLNRAVDMAKGRTQTQKVALVGFSGGGGAAALLAARRNDVIFLGTVAGTLDHKAWTNHHKVSPLSLSLNPIEVAPTLRNLPQRHLSGGSDNTMPAHIAQLFCTAVEQPETCSTINGVGHQGPWEQHWSYTYK